MIDKKDCDLWKEEKTTGTRPIAQQYEPFAIVLAVEIVHATILIISCSKKLLAEEHQLTLFK